MNQFIYKIHVIKAQRYMFFRIKQMIANTFNNIQQHYNLIIP